MKEWEKFEVECERYLKNVFGKYATFELQGKHNSNVSDILVRSRGGEEFYIEVKLCKAQCGQFVLLPNYEKEIFDYSDKNQYEETEETFKIQSEMNVDFKEFCEAGTAGKEIVFEKSLEVFSNHLIKYYRNKKVRYIITSEFLIIPIDKIGNYFNITARYRIKKSGSSKVGKSKAHLVAEYVNYSGYGVDDTYVENGELTVSTKRDINRERFYFEEREYMFSSREKGYKVRKLSKTFNANVIFTIVLKKGKSGLTDEEFITALNF